MAKFERGLSATLRAALAALACLTLSSCIFVPGRFESTLDVLSDGSFTYAYQGEMVFLMPQELGEEEWQEGQELCHSDDDGTRRDCSPDEIAEQRKAFAELQAGRSKQGEEIAELIGFNPLDAAANERLAARLMAHPGWNEVRYLGRGRYWVDYRLSGRLDRDFAFPMLPDVQMAMPFITLSRDRAGTLHMAAAGLASQQLRRVINDQTPRVDRDDPLSDDMQELFNLSRGTLTVTTDAPVTATNGVRSGEAGGQTIVWTIEGRTSPTPTLQLVLDP